MPEEISPQPKLEVEQLLAEYAQEVARRRKFASRVLWTTVPIVGLSFLIRMIASIGRMFHWWGKMPLGIELLLISTQLLMVIATVVVGVILWRSYPQMERLAKLNDVRVIGPLLEISEKHSIVSRPIFQALLRLLPLLKASDFGVLTPKQKTILYEAILQKSNSFTMNRAEQRQFQWVGLAAIEQIGDEKVLPMLVAFASTEVNPAMEEAIARCSVAVCERAERDKLSQTLLRASEDTGENNTLLKPAIAGHANTESLLRPHLS